MACQVDIRGVLDALGSQVAASGELAIEDVSIGDEHFVFPAPAVYDVTLTNTGAGIVLSGSVSATARTRCVRCLCDFDLDVTGEVEGFFVERGKTDLIPEEQEVMPIAEDRVDIEPEVRQALVVELPFAPVHAEDCAGICPTCGADLNAEACACEPAHGDSPFARLKDLLPDPDREATGPENGTP